MIANGREVGTVTIIDLSGPLTMGRGDVVLRREIGGLLQSGRKRVVLNLRDVPYVDSAGVGELLACHMRVQSAGGDIKLLSLSQRVFDLLDLSQLLDQFETFEDEAQALSSFASPT